MRWVCWAIREARAYGASMRRNARQRAETGRTSAYATQVGGVCGGHLRSASLQMSGLLAFPAFSGPFSGTSESSPVKKLSEWALTAGPAENRPRIYGKQFGPHSLYPARHDDFLFGVERDGIAAVCVEVAIK